MTYLHNQWEKLKVSGTDGRLRLSNIMVENAIHPFAVGIRAWLFSDTPAGANASSIHYCLIETGKIHELGPYAYLNAVFKALSYADTIEKIEELLPWNFQNSKPRWLLRTFNSAYCELLHHDKDIYTWKVRRFIKRLHSLTF